MKYTVLLLILFFNGLTVYSVELFAGISAQQSTLFISEKNEERDLAELENQLYFSPVFAVRSKYSYFDKVSSIGYFIEINSGYYSVDRQIVNNSISDLGTGISGLYFDLTPTLFYCIGKDNNFSFKSGLGLGFGLLYVNGNAVLTETALAPEESYNSFAPGFTAGIFMETVLENWFLQIKGYGPYVVIDNQDLFLVNVKLVIGKIISF